MLHTYYIHITFYVAYILHRFCALCYIHITPMLHTYYNPYVAKITYKHKLTWFMQTAYDKINFYIETLQYFISL